MSGLCGWFCRERSSATAPDAIAAMAAAITRFDSSTMRSATAGFGSVAVAGGDTDVFQADGRLVAVWGNARFSDPGLAALAQNHGVAHALAQGYARKGADVLTDLCGAFALAVFDGDEAMLATDRMGTHPLCYCINAGVLVFGSTLDAIGAFPQFRPRSTGRLCSTTCTSTWCPGP